MAATHPTFVQMISEVIGVDSAPGDGAIITLDSFGGQLRLHLSLNSLLMLAAQAKQTACEMLNDTRYPGGEIVSFKKAKAARGLG